MDKIDVSRSRENLVRDATANLLDAYEHLAASEALTRALVCERTEKGPKADFWVQVYLGIRASIHDSDEVPGHRPSDLNGGYGNRPIDAAP